MLRWFLSKFWDENVWLPPNTSWEDIEPGDDKIVVYTNYVHLLYPIPIAFVLIYLRQVLDKYWYAPFGKSLGIKTTRPKKAPSNAVLDAAYQLSPKIKHKQINVSRPKIKRASKSELAKLFENSKIWQLDVVESLKTYGVNVLNPQNGKLI